MFVRAVYASKDKAVIVISDESKATNVLETDIVSKKFTLALTMTAGFEQEITAKNWNFVELFQYWEDGTDSTARFERLNCHVLWIEGSFADYDEGKVTVTPDL